jgi:dTDP-4-dehydrorhamnose 3,5-epimerase
VGKFKRTASAFKDVAIISPTVFSDERGFFLETYNRAEFAEIGIFDEFVQDNLSHSAKGVVRGLHYQEKKCQGKLVKVLRGEIFDVVVDLRKGSETYGLHMGIVLSSNDPRMLYIPAGFAHGFMTLVDNTEVLYKVTDYYAPEFDAGIRWNDPELGIIWPVDTNGISSIIVSPKDAVLPMLKEIRSPFDYQVT